MQQTRIPWPLGSMDPGPLEPFTIAIVVVIANVIALLVTVIVAVIALVVTVNVIVVIVMFHYCCQCVSLRLDFCKAKLSLS